MLISDLDFLLHMHLLQHQEVLQGLKILLAMAVLPQSVQMLDKELDTALPAAFQSVSVC